MHPQSTPTTEPAYITSDGLVGMDAPGSRTIKARNLAVGATIASVPAAEPLPVVAVRRDAAGDVIATVDIVYGVEEGVTVVGSAEPDATDVGRCPRCGQQTRSYSRGCSYCGYGTPTTQAVDQLLDAIRLMTVRYGEATHAYAYAVNASRDVRMRHHRATNRRFLALQRLTAALTAYGAVTGTAVVIEDEVTSA